MRAILERVVVPPEWLPDGIGGDPAPSAAAHLDRIGYVFAGDGLD